MIFADIKGALQVRLDSLPNQYPIAWENVKFTPDGSIYLRPTFIPASTVQACLGRNGRDETAGLYQVDVFTPKGNGGNCIPDEIANHFYRQKLTLNDVSLRVTSVSILPAEDDTNYSITPVQISWQAYTEAR